jgi:hypothetical protein
MSNGLLFYLNCIVLAQRLPAQVTILAGARKYCQHMAAAGGSGTTIPCEQADAGDARQSMSAHRDVARRLGSRAARR